jgi:tetratricopeptide (TPR) repeat protein
MRFLRVIAAAVLGGAVILPAQEPSASLRQADADYKAGQAALARRDLNAARQDFERVVHLAPQAEQGHSALGAVEVALGQTAIGIRELEKALALDPKDSSAQLNLALAYEQTGATAKALPLFAKLETAKGTLPAHALAAYARALVGTQPAAALAKMQAAVAADHSNAELHDELGSLYAQRKTWPDAEQEFDEAVRLNAELAAAHLHLGLALEAQGKPGAMEELTKASQLAPTDISIGLELGKALAAADKDQEAIAVYQRVLEAHPESTAVDYQLALALQRTGNTQAAISLFEKTIAAEPANAEALANLGLALTQMQRAKEAIAPLKESVRLAPANVVAKQDLAAAYIQLNQLDEAVAQLKEAIALAPDSAEIRYNLGLAYKMEDNAVGAIPELEKAEKLNPNAPEAPYVLGVLYMQAGRYDDAARELDRSLKLQPQNGDGWATLGSVYAKLEKLPAAASALQEAIKQIPGQPDPHLTLAGVLAKQGDAAGAAAERKQAAALMRTNMNRERAEVATHSANGLLQSGKVEDAIAQFKEALSYDPDYADAHRGLARALEQQGDPAGAAGERQKADTLENAEKKP